MSKLAVIGSRTYDEGMVEDYLTEHDVMSNYSCIVSGGAIGADRAGVEFARRWGMKEIVHLPDWDKLGKSAAFVRNRLIAEDADRCIAFWDGKSKGTLHTINILLGMGKPVTVVVNGVAA
jgi:predicted Rossmann fold nucleotide-binding protein DprA/Smf involved in DNA uptake